MLRTFVTILALSLTASAGAGLPPFRFSSAASESTHLPASTAASAWNPIATEPSEHGPLPAGLVGWRGAIKEGGENITLTGLSHHDIASQLVNLGAHWLVNASTAAAPAEEAVHEGGLEKRGRVKYYCANGYPLGQPGPATHDANAIQSTMGNGNCGVGPRGCGRFACYQGTGVGMCNDDPNNWVWIPCSILATNVRFITGACTAPGYGTDGTMGQAFYEGPTYNVLVKGGYNC